jgi:rhomboid protease GluP
MKQLGVKFQLIIKPFLIIAAATICAYSFLHWWLLIENEILVVDEPVANFVVPLVVSFAPVLIWMRPRLKLLNFAGKKVRNPAIGYLLLAWIAIWVPTFLSQEYLISATGKITRLTYISQISHHPKTKYYTLKGVYADKQQARPYTTISVSGKHNVNYDMAIYLPCPIFDNKAQLKSDTVKPLAWLAIKYQKTIKNRLSAADKQREFNAFIKESQSDFDKRNLNNFSYLDRVGRSAEFRKYADAVTFSSVYNTPFIILKPEWGSFEDRDTNKLLWFVGSFVAAALIFSLLIALIPLKDELVNNSQPDYSFKPYKKEDSIK